MGKYNLIGETYNGNASMLQWYSNNLREKVTW